MPPARREKASADPIFEFSQSQSSNDLDHDLKTIMAKQCSVKLCKKKIKEEKAIVRDAVVNTGEELSEMGTELVEVLKAVQEAWESMILERGRINDEIARDTVALESRERGLVKYVSGLRKQAASDKFREQQCQSLERMRGVYEETERLWNGLSGDVIE